MLYKLLYAVIIVMDETFLKASANFLETDSTERQSAKPLTEEEAERLWKIHANDVLEADENYRRAESKQHRVGRIVAWSYTILVAGLLAFMIGFYLWRFRFFWAIVIYVVLLTACALAARTIYVHAVTNDHLGELVNAAHDRYVARLTGKRC